MSSILYIPLELVSLFPIKVKLSFCLNSINEIKGFVSSLDKKMVPVSEAGCGIDVSVGTTVAVDVGSGVGVLVGSGVKVEVGKLVSVGVGVSVGFGAKVLQDANAMTRDESAITL